MTGDRARLETGDIIYCGPDYWHDHKNEGEEDFIFWMCLTFRCCSISVFQSGISTTQKSQVQSQTSTVKTTPDNFDKSHEKYIHPWARPRSDVPARRYNEIHHFPWVDVRRQLLTLADEKGVLHRWNHPSVSEPSYPKPHRSDSRHWLTNDTPR